MLIERVGEVRMHLERDDHDLAETLPDDLPGALRKHVGPDTDWHTRGARRPSPPHQRVARRRARQRPGAGRAAQERRGRPRGDVPAARVRRAIVGRARPGLTATESGLPARQ